MPEETRGSSTSGHLWTLRPWLAHLLRPKAPPPSSPWTTTLEDPKVGAVRLQGTFAAPASAREAVLVVHGLGGSIASQYVGEAARHADRAGLACLCLNLRGAAGDGEDVYNAGLTADLRAAIASAELAAYETIFVLGYSLGGHLALRLATEDLDRRVRAVAAVCPPLDLDRTSAALDEPSRWVYRRNVLEGLKSGYAATIARQADRHLPTMAEVRAIRKLRAWDDRVVAPRFGYRSAEHYYAEASVAPRLGELGRPALVVAATHDPMIPAETLHPWLDGGHAAHPMLDARWVEEGGHVGFPPSFDLGLGGETGLEPQVFRWLRRAAAL